MKFCERCGKEIYTKDGENQCIQCQDEIMEDTKRQERNAKARARRQERESVMKDLGLVKVRGAMGGTYWE